MPAGTVQEQYFHSSVKQAAPRPLGGFRPAFFETLDRFNGQGGKRAHGMCVELKFEAHRVLTVYTRCKHCVECH